ncbi:hypothetical protein SAMN00017405_2274 [Desulfonispora thiosulfatigenes DSM 11270]|uniref:Uncharacterized protein n=1 Tax=Desulfonispora thiosulfatigenes DSM 11270 TaxID=656914 RepID=A0A1W1VCY7_DESTI|nr:hypothetical protein SAMN00017405_2274 [Desulfonispora thiosulfatigenes DSM 11270]
MRNENTKNKTNPFVTPLITIAIIANLLSFVLI